MTAPILDPWAAPAAASSETTVVDIVDPWATTQPLPSTTSQPLSTTSAAAPYRGIVRGVVDDVTTRPLRTLGEAVGGVALGAGRAFGIAEQGLGAAIEGIGGLVSDDDPRTFNPVQRLGRIIRRRGEGLTEQADLVEMQTTVGKGAKLVGDAGMDVLSTVALAGLRPIKAIGGVAASPTTQRVVRESLRYAVASAPSTAARSVAGESTVKAAAELLGQEELAQTLEGSMAKRVLGDLALNTTLGLGLDVGLAKIMQLRQAAQQAARRAPVAVPTPGDVMLGPARAALPSGMPVPTAGDAVLGPAIPMGGEVPQPQGQLRALLANPDPRPTVQYGGPAGPPIPMGGDVPVEQVLARAAAQAPPVSPLAEGVERFPTYTPRSTAVERARMVDEEIGNLSVELSGRKDVLQLPDEEASAVLRAAAEAGDWARRSEPGSIILSSFGAGQWKDILANPAARQTLMKGGVIGVGLNLQQAEDERLSGTGKDLVALGVLSLMYPSLRGAAVKQAGNLKERMLQSETGRKVLQAMSYDFTVDPVVKDLVTQYERTLAQGRARAAELATAAARQGPNVDRRISDLIEGESIEPVLGDLGPEVVALAQRIANEFAEVGKLKVGAGLMDQATLDAFNRKYLPRMYGKYMGEAVAEEIPLSGGRKIRLAGDLQRQNLPLEIRNELGEIREASVRTKIGLEHQYRQAATGMLFDQLSKVPGVILPESAAMYEAALNARKAYYDAVRDPQFTKQDRLLLWRQKQNAERAFKAAGETFTKPKGGYVRLPDAAGYGQLRGAVVRQDVADYLNMLPELEGASPWTRMLSLWKKSKTVFNPGTHVGNFMSNVGMAHMGGLPLHKQTTAIPRAISALRAYDDDVRFLAERGDLDRGLPTMGDPAVVNGPEEALQALMETTRVETRQALADAGIQPASALTRAARIADRKAQQLYGAGDAVFRVALFKELTQNKGMARDAAADFVRQQFVDYSTRSPALRLISRTVSPFVMFPAKALPRIADQVVAHPERWATLAMLWGGLDQYSRRQVGPLDPAELPEGERGRSYLIPGRVQLPSIGDMGDFYTLDMARWTPFSALTGEAAPGTAVGQLDMGLPALVSPSGPIADVGNLIAGRNSYTGQPLVTPSMDTSERLKTYGLEIMKFVAPTALGIHIPNVVQDVANLDMRAALVNSLGLLGAKPRVVTPGKEATYAEYEYNQKLADARKQYDRDIQRAQQNPAKQERLTVDYERTLLRVQAEYLQRLGALEEATQVLDAMNAMSSPGIRLTPTMPN